MLENLDNILEFTERLRKVFGISGAKTLEFVIAKELYRRLGLRFEPDGIFEYSTFLKEAERTFSKKKLKS